MRKIVMDCKQSESDSGQEFETLKFHNLEFDSQLPLLRPFFLARSFYAYFRTFNIEATNEMGSCSIINRVCTLMIKIRYYNDKPYIALLRSLEALHASLPTITQVLPKAG